MIHWSIVRYCEIHKDKRAVLGVMGFYDIKLGLSRGRVTAGRNCSTFELYARDLALAEGAG